MTPDVFRYTPDRRNDLLPGLAQFGYGQGDAATDAYYDAVLNGEGNPEEAVFVVRDKAGSLGMAQIMYRPIFGGTVRLVNYLMPQDDEAKVVPFGRALYEATMDLLVGTGIRRQAALARSDQKFVRKFVEACGFEIAMSHYTMGWKDDGSGVPEPAAEGVEFVIYRGGDAARNDEVAALWQWAFRRDPIEPVLTPDVLEISARDLDIWFVLALETKSGRLVGLSEAGPGSFFSGIAVARSHWGTKVAEGLSAATMEAFVERGHTEIHSMVRKTNRASVALHERMGWSIMGEGDIYVSPEAEV